MLNTPYVKKDTIKNFFPVPNAVFDLGLHHIELSIYAYLFELQNPNLKVSDLYACWLYNSSKRRKIDLVRVARKPKSDVTMLLECEYYGTPFLELEKYY